MLCKGPCADKMSCVSDFMESRSKMEVVSSRYLLFALQNFLCKGHVDVLLSKAHL